MKIQIMSDFHVNTWRQLDICVDPSADIILVPGDVHYSVEKTCEYLWQVTKEWNIPIFFCLGNHEAEDVGFENAVAYARNFVKDKPLLKFFQDDVLVYEGVTFIGATLWADLKLFGEHEYWFVKQACQSIHDFETIPDLSVYAMEKWHQKSVDVIEQALYRSERSNKAVVMTHFAPSFRSIHPQYAKDRISGYFASNLEHLMGFEGVWIHGHTHSSFDYQMGDTRVICNPIGTANSPNREYAQIVIKI